MKYSEYFQDIENLIDQEEKELGESPQLNFSLKKHIKSAIMKKYKGGLNPKIIDDDITRAYWAKYG